MKLISIIVPAYNVDAYLARCLDSILAQSYKNFEVILVDDGSSDKTPLICDEYSKKDNRIVVIHQKNAGVSAARNAALDIAKGEYIGCVDADDYIEPLMYEVMLKACEDNDVKMAATAYEQLGVGAEDWEFSDEISVLSQREFLLAYVSDDSKYRINHSVWSKLIKKELIGDLRFPVGLNSEDVYFAGKIFSRCEKCVYIDRPLYHYVVDRPGSLMNQEGELGNRRLKEELPFLKSQLQSFKEAGLDDIYKHANYQYYKRELSYYIDFKNKKLNAEAKILKDRIFEEKNDIIATYNEGSIKKGDQVRMKIFLLSPGVYYFIVRLYDKFIIPLRS